MSGEIEKGSNEATVTAVSAEDRNVAEHIVQALDKLYKVKNDLYGQDASTLPYSNREVNETAKELLLAHVTVEIRLAHLVLEVLRAKSVLKSNAKPIPDAVFLDLKVFAPWLNFVTTLHSGHCEGLVAVTQQFLANAEGRDKHMEALFLATIKCDTHKEHAITKTIDGKKFLCGKCVFEMEKQADKETLDKSLIIEE